MLKHADGGIVILAAEWFTAGEMVVLQCVSMPISVYVKEWQYKDILNDVDNLAWEDLSEEWSAHMSE